MVAQMFELMYEHNGIGLAANQVDLPFQMFVINPSADKGSEDEQVLINPIVQSPKGNEEAEEGCLSLPSVYGKVTRPAQVHVIAYDLSGNVFDEVVKGILARVIQHEFDHVNGVLFTDRMSPEARKTIEGELREFEIEFEAKSRMDPTLDPQTIRSNLEKLENTFC